MAAQSEGNDDRSWAASSVLFCTCAGIRGPDGRTAYQRVWGWPDITAARAGHQAVTAWTG